MCGVCERCATLFGAGPRRSASGGVSPRVAHRRIALPSLAECPCASVRFAKRPSSRVWVAQHAPMVEHRRTSASPSLARRRRSLACVAQGRFEAIGVVQRRPASRLSVAHYTRSMSFKVARCASPPRSMLLSFSFFRRCATSLSVALCLARRRPASLSGARCRGAERRRATLSNVGRRP